MTTTTDLYCMLPHPKYGFALVRTKFVQDGTVHCVDTGTLKTMKRKDSSLHFCSFAFAKNETLQDYFNSNGELKQHVVDHLIPIGIWGSVRTNEYVYMPLDGNDFRMFEYEMIQQGFCGNVLPMEGAISMGQEGAKPWHQELVPVVKMPESEGGEQ